MPFSSSLISHVSFVPRKYYLSFHNIMVDLIILKYMTQSYSKCRSWNWIVQVFYKSSPKQELPFHNHVLVRHGTTSSCQSYLWAFSRLFYGYLFSMIYTNGMITSSEAISLREYILHCHDPKCWYHDVVHHMLLNGNSLCILIVL